MLTVRYIIFYIILVVLISPCFVFLFDLHKLDFHNLVILFWEIRRPLFNTLCFGIVTSLLTVILGTSLFWIINFHNYPMRKIFRYLVFLPAIIPIYISGYSTAHFFANFGIRFHNYYGAIFVSTLSLYPYIYLLIDTNIVKVQNILVTSRLFGYNSWQIYSRLFLSSIRPTILLGIIIVFMETLSEYGMSKEYGLNNLTNFLYKEWFYLHNYHNVSIINIIIFGLIILCFLLKDKHKQDYNASLPQRRVLQFATSISMKFCMFLYSFFIMIFALLVPIGELIYSASLTFNKNKLFEIFVYSFHTLYFSSSVAGITIVFGYLICHFIFKKNSHMKKFVKIFTVFGYGIPGAFLSINLITWFNKILAILSTLSITLVKKINFLFFGTLFGAIYGSVFRFMNTAVQTIDFNKKTRRRELTFVKRIYSKNPIANLLWYAPLYFREILILFLILLIDSVKELPILLILRPFNFTNLTIKTFDFIADERYSEASIFALSLIFLLFTISGVLIYVVGRFEKFK